METQLAIFIAILPIILIGLYIYKKDRDKEPKKLLIRLFLGGVGSCIMVLVISYIMQVLFPFFGYNPDNLNLIELFIYVFVGVALVEEGSKFLFTYKISYHHKEFNETYDMILYAVYVSLGFACFENVFYVLEGGIETALLRMVLAVPAHSFFGVFMGEYLGMAKYYLYNREKKKEIVNRILSILLPTILHGTYDYCLFTSNWYFIGFFAVFVIFLYIVSIKKVKRIARDNHELLKKYVYCPYCGTITDTSRCPGCGRII